MHNLQIRIAHARAMPAPQDFERVHTEVDSPGRGQFLCRARWLSVEPWVQPPLAGQLVPARGVCEVIESRHDVFSVGDCVVLDCGLQQLCLTDGARVHRLHPGQSPASTALGVLGLPGMAAYVGLLDLAQVRPGETVLVSAAANAAGSTAGQIATIHGARAVGIAGSREKCDWVMRHARFTACINYRAENFSTRLRELAPRGVQVYFDNAGGKMLDTVLAGGHCASGGRVVLNDLVTHYDAHCGGAPDPRGLAEGAVRILTLNPRSFGSRREAFLRDAIAWFGSGLLAYKEDIVDGLPQAPEHLCRAMRGEVFGKPLVRL